MARIVKRQRYENRQPGYTDEYVIAYRQEDDGTFTVLNEQRPRDPHRDVNEAHVELDGPTVCIAKGKEPRSLERAEAIAHAFMLGYSEYVRSPDGKFPKGTRRVNL